MREWPKDRSGRTIQVGDTLKVFHFIGARRKRHYMYKYVLDVLTIKAGYDFLKVSHLSVGEGYYLVSTKKGTVLLDYEIVQGFDGYKSFEERPRLTT